VSVPVAPSEARNPPRVDLLYAVEILRADPEWPVKLALFLLVWAIPFLGWFVVLGWLSYGARRALSGVEPALLPPTTDLATLIDYASVGLKGLFVGVVWSLPATALSLSGVACIYFGLLASLFSGFAGAERTGGLSLATIPLFLCGGLVSILVLAVLLSLLSLPAAAATLRAELSGRVATGFEVAEVFASVRLVFREWLVNLVLLSVATLFAVGLASTIPILGTLVSSFLVAVFRTFAIASLHAKYLAAGGVPLPFGPLEPNASPPRA
jgi:hypothetical protein